MKEVFVMLEFHSTSFFPGLAKNNHKKMLFLSRSMFVFALGGCAYYLLEIAYRGRSHYSMFLCGGICLCGLYMIHRICRHNFAIYRWILGAMLITVVEFWCGVIVNLIFDLGVWDYSHIPYNLLGQICLPFCVLWFFLCIPADILCGALQALFSSKKQRKV